MTKTKKRIVEARLVACARCGYTREAHELANFADGAMIGRPVLICPFATWKSPEALDAVDPSAPSTGKPTTRV